MKTRLGWLACALALAALALPARVQGGEKVIEVGKEKEIRDTVNADDPKVAIDILGCKIELPAKAFAIKMESGKSYRIALNKDAAGLDPFLVVQDNDGKQLAVDDDSGGMLNSLLNFSPPATGTYKVYAAALGGAGGFTLKITATEAAKAKRLKVGADVVRVTDSLTKEALKVPFEVEFEADKTYQIDLMSRAFDSFLILEDSTGKQLATDDDGGDGLNSRLVFRAPANGLYRIIATSLGMRGTGNFVLEVRENK
jgi:hypothetical protein